jgi:hypothetical protein
MFLQSRYAAHDCFEKEERKHPSKSCLDELDLNIQSYAIGSYTFVRLHVRVPLYNRIFLEEKGK